jgi:D-sedoheptulose 7-phosphate isomerase
MKATTKTIIDNLVLRYELLRSCYSQLCGSVEVLINCYKNQNKVLICGNGGSAADAEHIVGELMKGFLLPRELDNDMQKCIQAMYPKDADYFINNLQQALPAMALGNQISLISAFANDKASDLAFAQQILGHGNKNDILIAISTSGNSTNVLYATKIAKLKGMRIIALTGNSGGKLKDLVDILINVPVNETYIIQEYHLPIYHMLCACIENEFFSKGEI